MISPTNFIQRRISYSPNPEAIAFAVNNNIVINITPFFS